MHYHPRQADALARTLRQELNDARRDHDRGPLEHVAPLNETAANYAETLRYSDEFGHHVDGTPQDRAAAYSDVRENLHRRQLVGADTGRAASATVSAWLDSPGHRETLLEPRMGVGGVGVACSTTTAYIVHVLAAGKRPTAALTELVGRVSPL